MSTPSKSLSSQLSDINLLDPTICRANLKGQCKYGKSCRFKHVSISDESSEPLQLKTSSQYLKSKFSYKKIENQYTCEARIKPKELDFPFDLEELHVKFSFEKEITNLKVCNVHIPLNIKKGIETQINSKYKSLLNLVQVFKWIEMNLTEILSKPPPVAIKFVAKKESNAQKNTNSGLVFPEINRDKEIRRLEIRFKDSIQMKQNE